MFDYLIHAWSLFDSLASAGTTMTNSELIEYILDGLGHEYKEFTTSPHLRQTLTFDEFFDLLLQEEQLQKRMEALSLSNGVALAIDRVAQNHHTTGLKATTTRDTDADAVVIGAMGVTTLTNVNMEETLITIVMVVGGTTVMVAINGHKIIMQMVSYIIETHDTIKFHQIIVHHCSRHHQIPLHFSLMSLANNVERMVIILVFALNEATMPTRLITLVLSQTQLIGVLTTEQPTTWFLILVHSPTCNLIQVLILSLLVTGLTFLLCILGMESYAHHPVQCILKRSYVFQPFGKIYYPFEDFVMIMIVISS